MPIRQTLSSFEYSVRDLVLVVVTIASVFSLYPLASLLLQSEYYGVLTSRPAPEFKLYDARGHSVSASDYRGKYVYLMFGYLRCSDVCHSQVFKLDAIAGTLARSDIEFLYLAMDSEADKPSALQSYFDRRGDNFTSLHATSQVEMHSVAKAFGAGFRISGNIASDSYSIDHPTRIFLIDPKGDLRLTYKGTVLDANKVADDFRLLTSKPQTVKS